MPNALCPARPPAEVVTIPEFLCISFGILPSQALSRSSSVPSGRGKRGPWDTQMFWPSVVPGIPLPSWFEVVCAEHVESEEPGGCRWRVLVLKRPEQGSPFWHHAKASTLDRLSVLKESSQDKLHKTLAVLH